MDDDELDLYADLTLEPAPASAPAPPPAPKSQNSPKVPTGQAGDAVRLDASNYSKEAMGELLSFLQEAGDDDEDDFSAPATATATAKHDAEFACDGSPSSANESTFLLTPQLLGPNDSARSGSPPAKRGRHDPEPSQQEPTKPRKKDAPAAGSADDDDDFEFDFEADLPAASSTLPTRGPVAPTPQPRPPPQMSASDPGYQYNPQTDRWEQPSRLPTRGMPSNLEHDWRAPREGRKKAALCRHHAAGRCKWGDQCYFSHGQEQLRSNPAGAALKRRLVEDSVAGARRDAAEGICLYPQALAIRLVVNFEDEPQEIMSCLFEAGLPAGTGFRAAVKALLRFCHPDKCKHPKAKQAVQVLGPLLAKTSSG